MSGLAPVAEWRIHIGAHKTATTHLQMTLEARREALRAGGVDHVPHVATRRIQFAFEVWKLGRELEGDALPDDGAERLGALLAPQRTGPAALLLSEENFLGGLGNALRPAPYAALQAQLRGLQTLARQAPMTLFLAIRGFDELVPSTYTQALRLAPVKAGFDGLKAKLAADPPSWMPVLRGIRRAVPAASLQVWNYADYRAHRAAITARLCGVDPGPLPEIEPPEGTRSPSAAAVAAVEALPHDLPGDERRARADAIYAASFAAGEPKWRPFEGDGLRAMRARFRKDLRRIEAAMPGALMRFNDTDGGADDGAGDGAGDGAAAARAGAADEG